MTRARDIASGADFSTGIDAGEVVPHIIPGVLYPAVHGLIDGDDRSIVDSSATPHVIYLEGNRNIYHNPPNKNTNHSHKSAIKTDGGSSQLRVAGHSDFAFGTGNFTIEMWAKFDDATATNGILSMWVDSSNRWVLSHYSNLEFFSNVGGTSASVGAARTRTTTWHHYAIVRSGTGSNETKVYVDGTLHSQGTNALNFPAGTNIYLGTRTDNGSDFTTYSSPMSMNMLRIVKGKAVYTGNFTAPTALTTTGGTYSSATNITNPTSSETVLLVNSDVGSHSGVYGTAQSNGRSYYYTDIKGSKPIKDARVGAHFGSQRHKFKSLQLLEQETATHGENIHSIDGREWIRTIGNYTLQYNINGSQLYSSSDSTPSIEITGYFSSMNLLAITHADTGCVLTIDGVAGSEINPHKTTTASPLGSRYVDRGSVANIVTGQTLGIHTVKITDHANSDENYHYGIELIAQDVSSTANKSKIQIPSQNVVSYGKKFTVSGTPHYNPFDGMSGAKTLAQLGDYIDTATSLGMDNWKAGTSNYYKPFNGGRVVKWVDSSGTIKTSVTMMPPNAQNIGTTASNAFSDGEVQAGTNDHTITFNTSAVDQSLSEVAKTFHYREFGNGAANGGASGSYADASMFTHGGDDIAYVMDDGLTSFAGQDVRENGQLYHHDTTGIFLTWIGTGLSYHSNTGYGANNATWAQNLPYGTHVLKIEAYAAYGATNGEDHKLTLDGVVIANPLTVTHADTGVPYLGHPEFTFHQPKMPPIPEDCVVLADYMLMADFVAQTSDGIQHLSKGTRMVNSSRDFFYDRSTGSFTLGIQLSAVGGIDIYSASHASCTNRLTAFGSNVVQRGYALADRYQSFYVNDTSHSGSAVTTTKTGTGWGSFLYPSSATTLGNNVFEAFNVTADAANAEFSAFEVVTPIHTSSHYSEFETPFLKELIGGDRNMEQNNLIVTPDGKSWDEVTRDTSYLDGGLLFSSGNSTQQNSWNQESVGDEFRGYDQNSVNYKPFVQKDFAIAYNKVICLKEGYYHIHFSTHENADADADHYQSIKLNGAACSTHFYQDSNSSHIVGQVTLLLKIGDYLAHTGVRFADVHWKFQIYRV